MDSSRSSSPEEDLGWRPVRPTDWSQVEEVPSEEIQVLLLGAPGSGKTRLQARYILRQFVDIKSELARRMGAHKHLRLLDGTSVHLVTHELRTGAGSEDARRLEDRQRERLLAQCDAVMLTFDPWAEETFEWISGKVADDILEVGHQKKRLTGDFVRLMDDLSETLPRRLQSPLPAIPFPSSSDGIPRRLDESGNGDNQAAFQGISIALDRSRFMDAEECNHEGTLPPLPPLGPAPSSLDTTGSTDIKNERQLEIHKDEKSAKDSKLATVLGDGEQSFISKHDSAISIESRQSTDSQTALLPAPAASSSSSFPSPPSQPPPREAHPALRPTTLPPGAAIKLAALMRQQQRQRQEDARAADEGLPGGAAACSNELPVLVVATMTDRLRDTTARRVTAVQGQRLARRFGPHCGYIETSARANANVDEAYGIIVEQVMARRAAARRDERARARLEAALQTLRVDDDGGGRGRGGGGGGGGGGGRSGAARTCVPRLGWDWNWLVARVPPALSWEAITGALGGGRKAAEAEMKVGGGLVAVATAAVLTRDEGIREEREKVVEAKAQESDLSKTLVAQQRLKGVVVKKGPSPGVGQDEIAGRSKPGEPAVANTTSTSSFNQTPGRPVDQTATATTGLESETQTRRKDTPPGPAPKSSQNNNNSNSPQAAKSSIADRPSNANRPAPSQDRPSRPAAAPRQFDPSNAFLPAAPPPKPETVNIAAAERASVPVAARTVSQLWTQEISSDGSVVMVPPPGTRTRGSFLMLSSDEQGNKDNESAAQRGKKTNSLGSSPPPPPPPPRRAKKTQAPPSPRAPPPPPKSPRRAAVTTTTKKSRPAATTTKPPPATSARARAAAAKTPKPPPRRAAPSSGATPTGRTGQGDEVGGRRKTPAADQNRSRSKPSSVAPELKKGGSISARPPLPKTRPKPKPKPLPQPQPQPQRA